MPEETPTHEQPVYSLIWGDRQKGESKRAIMACNLYLMAGPGRSLVGLLHLWQSVSRDPTIPQPPTRSRVTLYKWSRLFDWSTRCDGYDEYLKDIARIQSEHMLTTGLSTPGNRVAKLVWLAELLEEEISSGKMWLEEPKNVYVGKTRTLVWVPRYNTALVGDYRGALDDIAKETGGRRQKVDVGGEKDKPINISVDVVATAREKLAQKLRSIQERTEEQGDIGGESE